MKARWMKLICVGMIAMLLVSCNQKPTAQKGDTLITPTNTEEQPIAEDFPTLKIEKVLTFPTDDKTYRPLTLQGNQYFYRDFDYKSQIFHYKAVDINTKKILWDVVYNNVEFPMTHSPQIIQNLVLFTSDNRSKDDPKSKILALDINNGSIRWQRYLGGSGNMNLIQKTLFVPSWSNLYALDFQTGKLLWSKSIYDFFPSYSKEKDYYHIAAFESNQNTLFVGYTLEQEITGTSRTNHYGCIAIKPDNGSILWKYEKEYREWANIEVEGFKIVDSYLLAYGFTLLDYNNSKMLWQYKPENPEYKNPEDYLVGYIPSERILIYRTTYEIGFEKYGTTLFGVDINTGVTKWKQEVKEKGDSKNSQNLFCVDQNQKTNQICEFILKYINNEKGSDQTQINSMDVYDGQTGKLLQSYELPVSSWFSDLKSEIRFHEGWWYFIGETSQGDTLFRFQLNQ